MRWKPLVPAIGSNGSRTVPSLASSQSRNQRAAFCWRYDATSDGVTTISDGRVQHRARLNEEPTQVDLPGLAVEREAMLALWKAVFG